MCPANSKLGCSSSKKCDDTVLIRPGSFRSGSGLEPFPGSSGAVIEVVNSWFGTGEVQHSRCSIQSRGGLLGSEPVADRSINMTGPFSADCSLELL